MSTYQICFSPTGGTKKVSEYLSRQLNEDSINIDLTDRKRDFRDIALTGNDIAVIAVPSYGGRVPSPAVERIKQIQGNGAKAIIVCVYGNRAYEDTLAELLDCTQQAGFSVIAPPSQNTPSPTDTPPTGPTRTIISSYTLLPNGLPKNCTTATLQLPPYPATGHTKNRAM